MRCSLRPAGPPAAFALPFHDVSSGLRAAQDTGTGTRQPAGTLVRMADALLLLPDFLRILFGFVLCRWTALGREMESAITQADAFIAELQAE